MDVTWSFSNPVMFRGFDQFFFSPKVVCSSSRVKEVRNIVTLTELIFVIEVFNCSEVGVYLRDIKFCCCLLFCTPFGFLSIGLIHLFLALKPRAAFYEANAANSIPLKLFNAFCGKGGPSFSLIRVHSLNNCI